MIIDNLLQEQLKFDDRGQLINKKDGQNPSNSPYNPTKEERDIRQTIVDCFRWADVNKRKPRREFNDLSELSRMMVDQMAFNVYQPNNGQAYEGDVLNSWKSHALKPIVRNKVMSVTAHVCAKMLFPKIFAYNEQSEIQEDSATAMRDLIEWVSDKNEYQRMTLYSCINACVNPYSVLHLEYSEVYRTVKVGQEDGKWKYERILDEQNSGFKLTPVPCDEFFYGDFYTEDVQRQPYLIWRRVQTYDAMQSKYSDRKNFKYVNPGMQVIYNDANMSFYEVYDSNLRGSLCEEVIFYSRGLDLQIAMVNGVLMDEADNPNPRLDKNYPFIVFGYENFDEGRSICKKSLVFKMQPDADIVNTLYQLIIDGTYLNIMPPIIISGEEVVASDVIIPGVSTTISSESTVTPLRVAQDIQQGMATLQKIEESIDETSVTPLPTGKITAFQLSRIEQEQAVVMQPFVHMIMSFVKQYGNLVVSDILQHLTIPEVNEIIDNGELIYKTFVVHDRKSDGGNKSRMIKFDLNSPVEMDEETELKHSYDILELQGGHESKQELYRTNPQEFRKLKYMCAVSPDSITPMSDDLEKTFGLELFDRAIKAPSLGVPVDMEQVFKDFLFGLYPKAENDVNKYFLKEQAGVPQIPGQPPIDINAQNPLQRSGNTQNGSPLNNYGQPPTSAGPMKAMQNNVVGTPKI